MPIKLTPELLKLLNDEDEKRDELKDARTERERERAEVERRRARALAIREEYDRERLDALRRKNATADKHGGGLGLAAAITGLSLLGDLVLLLVLAFL